MQLDYTRQEIGVDTLPHGEPKRVLKDEKCCRLAGHRVEPHCCWVGAQALPLTACRAVEADDPRTSRGGNNSPEAEQS
jgi:hypothetical protein